MTNITQSIKVIVLAIILSFGISYVFAWTAPTQAPTGGNDSKAPLNTSNVDQTKNGNLFLNALRITNTDPAFNALIVDGGGYFGGGVVVGNTTTAVPGTIRYDGVEFLGYTGGAWKSLSAVAYAPGSKTYTTPGTYTFTVPDAVYSISTEVWGAGGGGGFGPFSMQYKGQHFSTAGGSGGGGGYARENSYPVTPGGIINITVGAGGTAGTETGLYFGNINITTGGKGGGTLVSYGPAPSPVFAFASGGFGGVSHDYRCNGGSCNGWMMCLSNVLADGGASSVGSVQLSGEKGSGCYGDWSSTSAGYSRINPGGTSGKSTNYLGQPVPNAGVGGVGTHNRNTPNAPGNSGQVIIWW